VKSKKDTPYKVKSEKTVKSVSVLVVQKQPIRLRPETEKNITDIHRWNEPYGR